MLVRQLGYLVALARERHFGRAAEACNVSQPALSAGIAALEAELGVPVVLRGHRFGGLTPEGERALAWARRTLADYDALRQDLDGGGPGGLSGHLRLGVIPATLPVVARVTAPLCARHPRLTVQVVQMSSTAIQRGLDGFELDAGLTYLENEPLHRVRKVPLYRERYLFLTSADAGGPAEGRDSIPWAEAARRPLCLLSGEMQNRRIVDAVLRGLGIEAAPQVETNSFVALCTHVREGPWSAILPHTYRGVFGPAHGLRAVPLVDPSHEQAVGLVVPDREPPPPLAEALARLCRGLDLDGPFGVEDRDQRRLADEGA